MENGAHSAQLCAWPTVYTIRWLAANGVSLDGSCIILVLASPCVFISSYLPPRHQRCLVVPVWLAPPCFCPALWYRASDVSMPDLLKLVLQVPSLSTSCSSKHPTNLFTGPIRWMPSIVQITTVPSDAPTRCAGLARDACSAR
ncbi:hypothetical protein VTK56DRAFT_2135 [Thermocarpiscus australiensis]